MDKERLDKIENNIANMEAYYEELCDAVEIVCIFLRETHKEIVKLREENDK